MRLLRIGLVLGVLAAMTACGSDDSASNTISPVTTSPATTSPDTTTATGEPSGTSSPTSTTEPPPTTELVPATTEPAPSSSTTATAAPTLIDVKVYFLRGERLAIAHRHVPGPATLRGALTELLAGPTSGETAAGLHSEIPDGTDLLDVDLAEGLATVDLSDDYADGGGTLSMGARIAQVVFTATQFDNSDRTLFWIGRAPVEFFGGEGIVLDEPMERMHVDRRFTGSVIVDTPAPGSAVTSPFTVTGEGDVYEGDFPIVVRRDGQQIAGPILGFAGAWGRWADFEVDVVVDAAPGPIDVVVPDQQGCTPGGVDCPSVMETVVPLILTD